MKILLTGFEPNDNGLNASELVLSSLSKNPPEEISPYLPSLEFKVMPGNTNILQQVVEETLDSIQPDICLGIGQAKGYNRINLERMAKNLRYFVTLDKAGNAPKGETIISDTPIAYWHDLINQDSIITLLEKHNIPAKVSNDCGTHLCNQIFYLFLHWKAIHNSPMKVGFVHIPILPQQVIQHWSNSPFMTMEMISKAISLIVKHQIDKV